MLKMTDMHAVKNSSRDHTQAFNRILYTSFTLLSLYFFFFKGDYGDSASNLAIALIFDPFDTKQTWKERPLYQRAWLIVHLLAVLALFTIQFTR
jgi:hypothetical protein